jgi:uncharacterized protein
MSSENLHAPRERLSQETLNLHFAIVSLMEELDAIDWYRQRADDAEDETLKQLLLHNMREEMEHASMLLEWIRRARQRLRTVSQDIPFYGGFDRCGEPSASACGGSPGIWKMVNRST